jgi:bacterial/archaeal transporter family-2 protein
MSKVIVSYLFVIVLGIVLALHLAMNSVVGVGMRNPRVGNALFWCIGALAAILIGITGYQPGVLNNVKNVHPILFTAGAIGATLVFAIIWLIPQVGARGLFLNLLAGQVLGGMILSHYGWLGSPVQKISAMNIIGAAVMILGVVLATYVRPTTP